MESHALTGRGPIHTMWQLGRLFLQMFILMQTERDTVTANEGTEFVVAFPKAGVDPETYLVFTAWGPDTAVVRVSLPRGPSIMEPQTLNVSGESEAKFELRLNALLHLEESGVIKEKILLIEADKDIIVQAFSIINSTWLSSGAFGLLPVQALSTEYITWTTCHNFDCFIIVLSNQNNTSVEVRLKMHSYLVNVASILTYDATAYFHGDVIHENLEEYEGMNLMARLVDLSGSVVASSLPVALISGGNFEYLRGPGSKDLVVEQIPPENSLGTTHVLVPFSLIEIYDKDVLVKVTLTDDETVLTYNPAYLESETETSQSLSFRMIKKNATVLQSSKPVLVVACLPTSHGTGQFDPACAIVTPVENWRSIYIVSISSRFIDWRVFIVLIALEDTDDVFYLNGNSLVNELNWINSKEDFRYAELEIIGRGKHVIDSSGCSFTGLIFETREFFGNARPLGWGKGEGTSETDSLRDKVCRTTVATTVVQQTSTPSTLEQESVTTSALEDEFTPSSTLTEGPTTPSAVEQESSTSAPGTTPKQCPCACNVEKNTEEALKDVAALSSSIVRELTVDKSELSATKRTKISAENKKVYQKALGSVVAVVFISLVPGCFIYYDIVRVLHFFFKVYRKRYRNPPVSTV